MISAQGGLVAKKKELESREVSEVAAEGMMNAQPLMSMANDQIGIADTERIRAGM